MMEMDFLDLFKGWNAIFYLIGVLCIGLILEQIIPWRRGVNVNPIRWARNASMTFYGGIILGLVPFLGTYAGSVSAAENEIGIFYQTGIPIGVKIVISVIVFDLATYIEHRLLHQYYIFWRTHRSHHADTIIDATTSLRFHPFESILRSIFGICFVYLLGIPVSAVLIYYGINVIWNTLGHTNIALPPAIDRLVSRIFITPHMHRLHHSTQPIHLDKNFGTIFSIWDQLFGTFCGPWELSEDEEFGLDGPEQITVDSFSNIILDPFRTPENRAIPKPD
ncbi:MAG: sterol desaturase [Hyphococcus sp.]|nr:MAG: sterol desaturase [Marinicaulis sp.]